MHDLTMTNMSLFPNSCFIDPLVDGKTAVELEMEYVVRFDLREIALFHETADVFVLGFGCYLLDYVLPQGIVEQYLCIPGIVTYLVAYPVWAIVLILAGYVASVCSDGGFLIMKEPIEGFVKGLLYVLEVCVECRTVDADVVAYVLHADLIERVLLQ